jgi:outer membrane protein assembly factor BamB
MLKARLHFGLGVLCAANIFGHASNSETETGKKEMWQYSTGAEIHASPIVGDNGTIYVGSGDRFFYAFNADGSLKWKSEIGYAVPYSAGVSNDGIIYIPSDGLFALKSDGSMQRKISSANSQSPSSPAIAKDGTIFVDNARKVQAFWSNGELRWEITSTHAEPRIAPSIARDGTVYASGQRDPQPGIQIVAFRPDGTEIWTSNVGYGALDSGIALGADGTLYFGGVYKTLYAMDSSGREKWRFTAGGAIESTPVVGEDGTIYFGANDGKLYAVSPDGRLKWTFTAPGPVISSPAVDSNGRIYFTSTGSPGSLNALDANGHLLWTAVGSPNNRTQSNFKGTGSPVLDRDGTLYVGDGNGSLYAFTAGAGPAHSSWPMIRHDVSGSGRQ